jgi:hypothetical protein
MNLCTPGRASTMPQPNIYINLILKVSSCKNQNYFENRILYKYSSRRSFSGSHPFLRDRQTDLLLVNVVLLGSTSSTLTYHIASPRRVVPHVLCAQSFSPHLFFSLSFRARVSASSPQTVVLFARASLTRTQL